MAQIIRQLLTLQERDQKILFVQTELSGMARQRQVLQEKLTITQSQFETARQKHKHIEAERKESELEVESLQQQIQKYSLQQYQTKKNDEYRALANEIENCKQSIRHKEDTQLELMEKAEALQKEVAAATLQANETKRIMDLQMADLATREKQLSEELTQLRNGRDALAVGLHERYLSRYERLLKHKGDRVVVGVDRGVCGGCHMTLPPQIIVSCQAELETDQDLMACPNCGRIVYYSPEMSTDNNDDR